MASRRTIDARILALADAGGGVVTAAQLAEAGISGESVRSRTGGLLTRVVQGVYAVGRPKPDQLLRAVLAARPDGAGARATAAIRHGLRVPAPDVLEVVVAGRTFRRVDGVVIRHTRWLPADDVVQVDGVALTSVARTLCDLAAAVYRARLRHLVEQAIADAMVTPAEIQACASVWCRRGRPGSGVVRALNLELLDTEPVAASVLERRALRLFRRAGLTGWVSQYRPPWYDGLRGVVDVAWPELGIIVELDGRRWHTTTQAQVEDRRRDRAAVAHGWVTLRFGWQEIVHQPAAVVDDCRRLVAARRATQRRPTPN